MIGYGECEAHYCYDPHMKKCRVSTDRLVLAGTECLEGHWCIEGDCIPNSQVKLGGSQPTCDCKYRTAFYNQLKEFNGSVTTAF